MSDLLIHRGINDVESLKLKWEKLLGETRFASFTQSWHWYRVMCLLAGDQYEPVVLEAMHSSGTLGLLPLLSDRFRKRWISPQLLMGFGNAAPIGSQPTATWLRIGRHFRDELPARFEFRLGPFPHGTGTSSRLTTAFEQLLIPQVSSRKNTIREIDLQQSNLRWLDQNNGQTLQKHDARQMHDSQWIASVNRSLRQGGSEVDWTAMSALQKLVGEQPVELNSVRRGVRFTGDQLSHLYGELAPQGLAHLLLRRGSHGVDAGALLLGDRNESVVLPVFSARLANHSHRANALRSTLCRLRSLGFQKATILGAEASVNTEIETDRLVYSYWYSSQWSTQTAFKQLWHRMVPSSDLTPAALTLS